MKSEINITEDYTRRFTHSRPNPSGRKPELPQFYSFHTINKGVITMNNEIKLGNVVKDTITGFEGIATAITWYLNGCVRVMIQPKKLKDGVPLEAEWIDRSQLKVVKSKEKEKPAPTGGDRKAPKEIQDPEPF